MLCQIRSTRVTIFAPAKLNLFLKVLGKRDDGYHELETLMVSVDLYDTLVFSDAPDGALELTCRDAGPARGRSTPRKLPGSGADNLVLRAAHLMREATGTQRGARIDLWKRIPLAAGLAGGSTDAAAALAGLNRLWGLGLTTAQLMELAGRLGSDIPFFLGPTPAAICRGRGEIVEPFRLEARMWFVVARPPTGLSTPLVFRHCRPGTIPWSAADLAGALAEGRPGAERLFHNSLQAPAETLNADVVTLRQAFARQPFLGHQMSGSGTSYFGWCRSRLQAAHCAARLAATRLGDVYLVSNRP